MTFDLKNLRIGVVGLGYVGLPLAVEFGKKYPTVGFDVNSARVAELEQGTDSTLETTPEELATAQHLVNTVEVSRLGDCNFYVVTVPTPIGDSLAPCAAWAGSKFAASARFSLLVLHRVPTVRCGCGIWSRVGAPMSSKVTTARFAIWR